MLKYEKDLTYVIKDAPVLPLHQAHGYEMDGHVEVVRLELVRHLAEALERVLLLRLLEPEGLHRLAHLREDTLGTPPVPLHVPEKYFFLT